MKIYTITLGFCPWQVLEAGMKSYYETALIKPDVHYFLDQHYPMRREENVEHFKEICDRHGITMVDSGSDRGMCGGWNFLVQQIPFEDGDVMIGYDPDAKPEQKGWDRAMLDVLAAEPLFDMAIAAQSFTEAHIYPIGILKGSFREVAGHRVFQVNLPSHDMMTIGVSRWELCKGRQLTSGMSYWGGTEATVVHWMMERGKTYGVLMDFQENNGHALLGDVEYRNYKNALIGGYNKSFAEFLQGL